MKTQSLLKYYQSKLIIIFSHALDFLLYANIIYFQTSCLFSLVYFNWTRTFFIEIKIKSKVIPLMETIVNDSVLFLIKTIVAGSYSDILLEFATKICRLLESKLKKCAENEFAVRVGSQGNKVGGKLIADFINNTAQERAKLVPGPLLSSPIRAAYEDPSSTNHTLVTHTRSQLQIVHTTLYCMEVN